MSDKPKFDPSKSFTTVKPKFDPSKSFNAVDKTTEKEAPKTRDTQVSDFIPNLKTPEALLSGFNSGALMGYDTNLMAGANTAGKLGSTDDYTATRDAYDKYNKNLDNTNPLGRGFGKAIGGIIPGLMMPVSKLAQGGKYASQLAAGALDGYFTGAAANPGNTAGTIDPIQLQKRNDNANTGAILAPAFMLGTKAVSKIPDAGRALSTKAEEMAYQASKPSLKNYKADTYNDNALETGRWLLDEKHIKPFGTTKSLNQSTAAAKTNAGTKLDNLYAEANAKFSGTANNKGFNPVTDKAEFLKKAENELGDSVGGQAALSKLGNYIDEMAVKYGDASMTPRKTNDLKGALDEAIDYARNNEAVDPAFEKAAYGGRKYLSNSVDEAFGNYGTDGVTPLKAANRDYGMAAKVSGSTSNDLARTSKNKGLGLTDWIAIGGGGAATLATQDPKTAVMAAGALGLKKGIEKYGLQTGAYSYDKVGNLLQKMPELQDLSKTNPELANSFVQRYLMMNQGEK